MTHLNTKDPSLDEAHSLRDEDITTLDITEIESKIKVEENLEEALVRKYPKETSSRPRFRHDSIPHLFDLAYGITQISLWKKYTISDRVRNIVNLDTISLEWDINNFLSNNRQRNHRNLLNRIWKIIESILAIKNNWEIVNWKVIFSKLESQKKAT